MIVSRVKAGFFVIGAATVLFCLAVILAADSKPPITSANGFLFLLSLTLMIIGVYFVRSSKICPVCGERVARNEADCRYCRHAFKNDPATHTEHSAIVEFILKKFAKFILKASSR